MDSKTILIVDDEKNLLAALESLLATEGYSVIAASRGRDAVVLAKSRLPDLVILDVMMPDMDGGRVAEALKELPETKDIPIMFLTALLSKKEQESKGGFVGESVCLAKPYEADDLLAEVEKILTQSSAIGH